MSALVQAIEALQAELQALNPDSPALHFSRGVLAAGVAPVAFAVSPQTDIIGAVAHAFRFDREALTGAGRKAEVAEARFAAMLVMRRKGMSLPKIGAALGGRDHTTCIHGVSRAEQMERDDPNFARIVQAVAAGTQVEPRLQTGSSDGKATSKAAVMAEAAKAYADGLDLLRCAEKFGISANLVRRALDVHGVAVRRKGGRAGLSPRNLERVDQIMRLRADGKTGEEIGRELGITRERVRQIVVKAGLDTEFGDNSDRPFTPEQKAILDSYRDGHSLQFIASRLGVHGATARSWLTRSGIEIRPAPKLMKQREVRDKLAGQIAAQYLEGRSLSDIARCFGFKAEAQIYRYLAIAGVAPSRRNGDATAHVGSVQ